MKPEGCLCGEVHAGSSPTGTLNWNPDCPVHTWNEAMQRQADRAVAMQRIARATREGRREPGRVTEAEIEAELELIRST